MYRNFKRNLPRSLLMGTLIRRREDPDFTEMMNEIGTTKESIGDATMEVMLTTPGEIPEQFYDFDANRDNLDEHQGSDGDRKASGFGAHSTLFSFLIMSLILLIMVCCISACVIARARRKYEVSSDMECDADCQGSARQPLINSDKLSETTSKTTNSAKR